MTYTACSLGNLGQMAYDRTKTTVLLRRAMAPTEPSHEPLHTPCLQPIRTHGLVRARKAQIRGIWNSTWPRNPPALLLLLPCPERLRNRPFHPTNGQVSPTPHGPHWPGLSILLPFHLRSTPPLGLRSSSAIALAPTVSASTTACQPTKASANKALRITNR